MSVTQQERKKEFSKYDRAYEQKKKSYRMKKERMEDAVNDLKALPCRGSYLDVACGQGDMLDQAQVLGFNPVCGTEIVQKLIDNKRVIYGEVHDLPFTDKSFDVVTMFDVIEHLIRGDDEKACKELMRIARKFILLTANSGESFNEAGDMLHINRRSYETWDKLFHQWFVDCNVIWIKGKRHYISECWRIEL